MSDITLEARADNKVTSPSPKAQWMPREASPLAHVEFITPDQLYQQTSVDIREIKGLTHFILRGKTENPVFTSGVEKALGVALPIAPGTSVQTDRLRVFWQSPDEWLIIGEPNSAVAIELALHQHLEGHYAVTEVSSGQTLLSLSGANAENVIKKSTLYDVHIRQFPIGHVAGTTFAKSQVQIRRIGEQAFELVVRRSFADYLWMWLMDAGREYGVVFHKD
ncbi:sarcosine oxidase subunit gamma [Vibrio zhanjiangensis]|uniref:Sarcosine oxidase subunit gamma n=1 Tax=Vibrio zhanjiangensis TaxID=1046128 RepID=A0ABQ6F3G0_9VIBR|nr:sarcosine oxidase subunit gamma family protein [Vibrio zhanjiangensis]GLT19746.1 sarcosine oxidase subunit gamma [Vibrio zhanjiangensis]